MKALKLIALALFLIDRSHPLPSLDGRSTSTALFDTEDTQLGRSSAPLVAAHLASPVFISCPIRTMLSRRVNTSPAWPSARSIFSITSGKKISPAPSSSTRSERPLSGGVRVRLLLDDNDTYGLDPTLAALDAHPNIEVRLFNPFVIRKPRIGYVTEFFRVNRRMHNKSFTADNQVTIIGGRNVGDGGLALCRSRCPRDRTRRDRCLEGFDRYWASASSYPADRIIPKVDSAKLKELSATAEGWRTIPPR